MVQYSYVRVQAYFLENCVQMQKYENSLVFSNFQLVLLRTSELEFTGIWQVLLRSTSLSALSAAQNLRLSLDFRLSTDALEEKSDLQVFWILMVPGPKRDLEKKKSATMGSKFQSRFFGRSRAASCSAASAGPEKWSGISHNSKIVWETGLQSYHRSRSVKPVYFKV